MNAPLQHFPLLTAPEAGPVAGPLLETIEAANGAVPNLYRVLANTPGLLATYVDGAARFRSESGFTATEQDVVLLTLSRINECTYCMAAHSFLADRVSKTPTEVTDALRDDRPLADQRLAALAAFTQHMVETAGRPTSENLQDFYAAGFTEAQVLAIVLAVSVKTISNWSNHLFGTPVDDMFAERAWQPPAYA
ncbi:MAG: carboxymuconolactone decarboxylase family protein [Actinobacteria bacterium]|jgi:uncharacterized peroxidase-related enzyme|nr:carboxymuconolactone decarboxylase family protein [Actinomycetota bacterium]MBT4302464.1 carboxymuconolactone decarboxylase family protein [Actinomycetota bacterium]MBT4477115.1 carboxymuconolactone decarboxylase family protein [Actinomycetota bacterium]MBT4655747.1 carboxymuconolactone decarboxylase family protein [Actinomycetota bacterium]MBT5084671.1 carboxymuconolactone decarboxylase family protein [Actinomycetota bacterium]